MSRLMKYITRKLSKQECIVDLQHALVVAEHDIERDPKANEAVRTLVKAGKEHNAIVVS